MVNYSLAKFDTISVFQYMYIFKLIILLLNAYIHVHLRQVLRICRFFPSKLI